MHDRSTLRRAPFAEPPTDLLRGASLFLDFDGTLVDLAERPDAVRVSARLKAVLAALGDRLKGRLAIVSGRSVSDIDGLIGERSYTVVGSHGMEFHFADGRVVEEERPAGLDEIRHSMEQLAREWPHVLVEDKPLGSVLHYRLSPDAETACTGLAADLAQRHGLHLQTGKMMVEVRAAGGNKGSAIRQLMHEPEMLGTTPVFIGDDDTDEPGFEVTESMGGAGILVGPSRLSAARYRLANADAVIDWLEAACRA